jgi:phosphoglycerol transferase
MFNFFKNLFIFLSIFFLNFISISFYWIKKKFGIISFQNLKYHLGSLFEFNEGLLIPAHHLQESFIYYSVKINFIISLSVYIIWLLLFMLSNKKKFKTIFYKINIFLILLFRYKFIWLLLIFTVILSSVHFLQGQNFINSKKISLKDHYIQFQKHNLNKFENKNLIMVYVESLDQNFNNFKNKNLLPEFSQFKNENISLKKFTQLNHIDWTMAGIFSSQCGLPLKNYTILKENFVCISDILKQNNYENYFLLGHESEFQNLNNFLMHHKYDFIIDKKYIEKNFNQDFKKSGWAGGFNDEALFTITNFINKNRNKNKNYFLSILTSDTHGPLGEFQNDCKYKYPIRSLEESVICFDKRLSLFLKKLTTNQIEDTVIIVLSDHLLLNGMRHYQDYIQNNNRFLTNLFLIDKIYKDKFQTKRQTFNHYDVFPSTLNLINVYDKKRLGLGISIFDKDFSEEEAIKRNLFFQENELIMDYEFLSN